ncbi:hypothetical protein [Thalassovita aquimarina]|uniref:Glutathione-dependent formaldehyde-activating enzyme n=1 Tax=Thalassovita aquimarina TaxID=2785917 RepID=A0ABS5HSK8_9RHOB|nr:hypothetical protein [Thalassovita aquimarina]MBR9651945.1 hypothetical protein [Thalassovita aquimarina]
MTCQFRIPGLFLDIECRCGHHQTVYERADGPSWIGGVTVGDVPRMRCSSCGRIGQVVDIRKGWQTTADWSSSN